MTRRRIPLLTFRLDFKGLFPIFSRTVIGPFCAPLRGCIRSVPLPIARTPIRRDEDSNWPRRRTVRRQYPVYPPFGRSLSASSQRYPLYRRETAGPSGVRHPLRPPVHLPEHPRKPNQLRIAPIPPP